MLNTLDRGPDEDFYQFSRFERHRSYDNSADKSQALAYRGITMIGRG